MWQWDNTISYDNTFGGVHRINAMLGTSASNNSRNYTNATRPWIDSNLLGTITSVHLNKPETDVLNRISILLH